MNVLASQDLTIKTGGHGRSVSLPELLALFPADEVTDLPALRPHQRYPLHCFLAQIGAMAMLAGGEREPPRDADRWRELLRGLTPGFPGDEPWSLVVDDLSKPALLQPPVPEGALDALREVEMTPDALDMLVTAKNHDLKAARLDRAELEHWLYALVTLQTWEGFLGRGNYGISRMNGGFASRPFVGPVPAGGGWGAHLASDMRLLVAERKRLTEADPLHTASGGLRLVWLEPWDGTTSIEPKRLDPYYVEVCRRVRLRRENGSIVARRGSSTVARIDQPKIKYQGKDHSAPTGDPWTPVEKGSAKPLTLDGSGFHYRRVVNLLDQTKFDPSPLLTVFSGDPKAGFEIMFAAVVRGQGETQGYHERRIAVPARARPLFLGREAAEPFARLARGRVDDVAKATAKALRPALFSLFQAAPGDLDFADPKAKAKAEIIVAQFERAVDAEFFEHLMGEAVEPVGSDAARARRKTWLEFLWQGARETLAAAEAGSPLSGVRRYRARAAAEALLDNAIVSSFPHDLKRKGAA